MDNAIVMMLLEGIRDTLYMTVFSTLFAYVLGLPLAICLVLFKKDGLKPIPAVHSILNFITNILRSVPFLILMILVIPLTKLIVGKSYGSTADGSGCRSYRSSPEYGSFGKQHSL